MATKMADSSKKKQKKQINKDKNLSNLICYNYNKK